LLVAGCQWRRNPKEPTPTSNPRPTTPNPSRIWAMTPAGQNTRRRKTTDKRSNRSREAKFASRRGSRALRTRVHRQKRCSTTPAQCHSNRPFGHWNRGTQDGNTGLHSHRWITETYFSSPRGGKAPRAKRAGVADLVSTTKP